MPSSQFPPSAVDSVLSRLYDHAGDTRRPVLDEIVAAADLARPHRGDTHTDPFAFGLSAARRCVLDERAFASWIAGRDHFDFQIPVEFDDYPAGHLDALVREAIRLQVLTCDPGLQIDVHIVDELEQGLFHHVSITHHHAPGPWLSMGLHVLDLAAPGTALPDAAWHYLEQIRDRVDTILEIATRPASASGLGGCLAGTDLTPALADSILSRLSTLCGLRLVCLWDLHDGRTYRGNPRIHIAFTDTVFDTNGRLEAWLDGRSTTPHHPANWHGRLQNGLHLHRLYTDGSRNYALRTDHPATDTSVPDTTSVH